METRIPALQDVRDALARVVSSQSFTRAGALANLLQYVVERAAAGQADAIKEYTIAVEVFKRESYDSKVDSLVRVEATKLRKRLARYYETEGSRDPIRIEIPTGSYVPVFRDTAMRRPRAGSRRFRIAVSAGVVSGLLAAAAVYYVSRHEMSQSTGTPRIAVLPFADLSATKNRQYLCDGLTEELTTKLARLGDLRVASHTSTSQFKDRSIDVRRAGKDLEVQALLEGSVRMEGSRVTVIARLVDADDGFQLWTYSYDHGISETSDIQREIADTLFRSFQFDLKYMRRALVRPHSRNPEARRYYLDGAKVSGFEPLKAIQFYEAATAADPKYALAWADLSQELVTAVEWDELRASVALPKARESAQRALSLDPGIAEAHQALGKIRVFLEQDWAGAKTAFRRAIQLDPTHVDAVHDYVRFVLTPTGQFSEAVQEMQRAISLNPQRNALHNQLANTYIKAGQYSKAIPPLERSRALSSTAPAALVFSGMVSTGMGDFEEAVEWFEKAISVRRTPWVLSHLGHTYAKMGRTLEARKIITELEQKLPGEPGFDYEVAVIWAGLGEIDKAFEALDRTLANRPEALIWVKVDHMLDDLRADPRFQRLLNRMRLN